MSILSSAFSSKHQFLALGGQQGDIMVYDVKSRSLFVCNNDVHYNSEIMGLFFFEAQSQMISCARNREIALWEANNFECLQVIHDLDFETNFFNSVCVLQKKKAILAATCAIK